MAYAERGLGSPLDPIEDKKKFFRNSTIKDM